MPTTDTRAICLDMDQVLGGLPDGSIQVAAGSKTEGVKFRPASIKLDMNHVLGGVPDGSLQVAAGSKAIGTKTLGLKRSR